MKALFLPDCQFFTMCEIVEATAAAAIIDLNRSWTKPSGILLDQAREHHMRALVEMAQRSEICPCHALFHTRLPDFKPEDVDKCMVSFSDAQRFCRSLEIDLQPEAAPVVDEGADAAQATRTKEQRQDRRLQACIDAGLPMEARAALTRLPDGVGGIADREGVTRQAFSTDVKVALKRRESTKREGAATVHRA